MTRALRKLNWVLSQQLGLDLRRLLRAPAGAWRYARGLAQFRAAQPGVPVHYLPCVHDWWQEAGAIRNEYFWQDLIVARMVHQAAPRRHIDVGSRLDGFVAHLASFREVDVFDVRPLATSPPGVRFVQADLMQADPTRVSITDSLSCLHAIEHFGLGRYGDPIRADGLEAGLRNLAAMLEPSGRFYLSCPTGADAVHFNAHRTVHPRTMQGLGDACGLVLEELHFFDTATAGFTRIHRDAHEIEPSPAHSLALYIWRRR